MGKKIVFSTWIPRMYALALVILCASAILTPASGQTWAQESPATSPSARWGDAMAYDSAHGQVVLFGGRAGASTLADTWVWDGANWSQKSPSNSPPARYLYAMAYDAAHGQVVLFGGAGSAGFLADTWVWDGNNWTLKSPGTFPSARYYHAMAYDAAHGQVVLFGGYNGAVLGDTWVWDGNNWTQKSPTTTPPVRFEHAMAYDSAHGQVVLFGGADASANPLSDTWTWDGANWTQKLTAASPSARLSHAMTYDSAHAQVVLFGGTDNVNFLGDTWVWDGTNWDPESTNTSPAARQEFAMAYDAAHGRVVLFGGVNSNSTFGDTWLWYRAAFENWAQESPAITPPARALYAMAYDSSHGQTVLFAGLVPGGVVLDDTWVWGGSTWTQKAPVTSPPARYYHSMAYDAGHGQVVLFGGNDVHGIPLSDTWVWDGANWTQKSPAASPPARSGHALAYDSLRGQVVLYGGAKGSTFFADTWVWDGNNWTQKSPAASPPARSDFALAYDSVHGQVVLFGGTNGTIPLGDTWVWDGSNWTQKSPGASPPPRLDFAMAYDSVRGQVLLFGGKGASIFGDTWVWDGTSWTQKSSNASPISRYYHAMAYDSLQDRVVLFGGYFGPILSDTWLWRTMSVSPNNGSGTGPQEFSARYFDANGASDLQVVYLDFGSVGDAPHNCKVGYVPASNALYLFNDPNNGALGPITLGGGGSLSNSQCTLFGGSAGTVAVSSGINLTVPFTIQFLAGYGGLKTIFAVAQSYTGVQSDGGAFEALGTWMPAASTPGVVSVNPSSGAGSGPQIFTAVYSDTGGANDLQAVYLDFGSVGFAARNCIVVYVPGPNQLYLFADDNSSALGPIAEGAGGGSLSNSQCTLFSGNSSATLAGNTLTVPFTIEFSPGYGGRKTIFGLSQTYAGAQSSNGALQTLGTWTPAATTPNVVSVNPNTGSGLSIQAFTTIYSDTGGASDLQVVYLSFGPSFLAPNSCNVGYEPGNNTLFLFSDNNSTIATLGEGLGASVSNSQCTLYGGSSPAASSGDSLTVPFTISFAPINVDRTIFGLAQTYGGTQSAVTTLGDWRPCIRCDGISGAAGK